jgi:hypothetical protein
MLLFQPLDSTRKSIIEHIIITDSAENLRMGSNNGKDGLSAVANSETETDAASAVTTTATAMMMKSMSSVRNNDEGDEEKILSTATITTIAQQSELSESNVARRTSIVQYDGGYAEATLNMILFDPPRWGWTAVGGVVDLLSPHEVRCLL